MIFTVTLNPACDRTVIIERFHLDQVNRVSESRRDPGGKSINVSKVIRALGGESVATGLLGGETGDYIASALEKMGIRQRFVRVSAPTRTNLKIVDPVEGTYTDVNDSGEPAAQADIDRVLELLLEEAKAGDVAVLAGKLPRGAKEDTYGAWTRALKAKGVSVYVDAEGEALVQAVRAAPALIKPNEKELADLTGREASSREEIARSAEKLLKEGVGTVVVSLGAEGALCFSGEERWQAKGLHVEVKSTVGAGDSMMAAMALGEERGMPLCERFRLAMATSAAKVTMSGSQPPEKEAVDRLLEQVEMERF